MSRTGASFAFETVSDTEIFNICAGMVRAARRSEIDQSLFMARNILLYATLKWPSAARYAGGFAAAGCTVYALSPDGAPVQSSRYVSGSHIYSPLAPLRSLRKAIARAAPDLIVPCDDRAVRHLLRLYHAEPGSAVAALVARSIGQPENYERVLSRSESLAALRKMGVRVPDTLPVTSEVQLDDCLAVTGLPAVLKADESWGGEGVVIANTPEEAHAAYRKLSSPPSRLRSVARTAKRRDLHFLLAALKPAATSVCVQRFVEGQPAASAFAANEGGVVGALYYDVLVTHGAIGPPSVIRRVDCPEMAAATRAAAECFGLSGIHGLDFIRDASGAVHLIEINPRTTQGGTLPFGTGRDLPSALASTLTTGPVGMRRAIDKEIVVFFPREWKHNPASPYLKTGHHDVPWDDPAVMDAALGAA